MVESTTDTRLGTLVLVAIGVFLVMPVLFVGFGMLGSGTMLGAGTMMGETWHGGMWGDGSMPGWVGLVGFVLQVLFLAALAGGGYLVYRAATGDEPDSDPALEELRVAYARGDLTDEEYEQRRVALERDE